MKEHCMLLPLTNNFSLFPFYCLSAFLLLIAIFSQIYLTPSMNAQVFPVILAMKLLIWTWPPNTQRVLQFPLASWNLCQVCWHLVLVHFVSISSEIVSASFWLLVQTTRILSFVISIYCTLAFCFCWTVLQIFYQLLPCINHAQIATAINKRHC